MVSEPVIDDAVVGGTEESVETGNETADTPTLADWEDGGDADGDEREAADAPTPTDDADGTD